MPKTALRRSRAATSTFVVGCRAPLDGGNISGEGKKSPPTASSSGLNPLVLKPPSPPAREPVSAAIVERRMDARSSSAEIFRRSGIFPPGIVVLGNGIPPTFPDTLCNTPHLMLANLSAATTSGRVAWNFAVPQLGGHQRLQISRPGFLRARIIAFSSSRKSMTADEKIFLAYGAFESPRGERPRRWRSLFDGVLEIRSGAIHSC